MKFKCCKTKENQPELNQLADFLKIIAEKNRLKILCLLYKQDLCVCEIWQHLALSQNLVSHHLKVLKDFNLVSSKKDGLKIIYTLNYKNVKKYTLLLTQFI